MVRLLAASCRFLLRQLTTLPAKEARFHNITSFMRSLLRVLEMKLVT